MLIVVFVIVVVLFSLFLLCRPYEIVRPSVWFSLAMIAFINFGAAFSTADVHLNYNDSCFFRHLALIFPCFAMFFALLTPKLSQLSKIVYIRCRLEYLHSDKRIQWFELLVLGCCSSLLLHMYLREVPFLSTGLARMFSSPAESAIAREESLKLISNPIIKYGYTFHMKVFAPLLVGFFAIWRPRMFASKIIRVSAIALLLGSVMLTGARAPAGGLLVVLGIIFLLHHGIIKGGVALIFAGSAAILIAATLSIVREGKLTILSLELIAEYLRGGLFERVFHKPYLTGIWTNLFAQDTGLIGIHNIRPLAVLFGVDFWDVPNSVALAYVPNSLPTSSATTSFLFSFQSSFGLIAGWLVAGICLLFLDFALIVFLGMPSRILVPVLAAFLLATMQLISSGYTTSLLTHGILPILVLGIVFSLNSGLVVKARQIRPTSS